MSNQYSFRKTQSGISLLISLVMLVMLTLMVLSAVSSNSLGLRVVGNMQAEVEALSAAQFAIEQKIGTSTFFTSPATSVSDSSLTVNVDLNGDGTNDHTVVLAPPACLETKQVSGYDPEFIGIPQDTLWDVKATVTDNNTGVNVVLHQGVKMRMQTSAVCVN